MTLDEHLWILSGKELRIPFGAASHVNQLRALVLKSELTEGLRAHLSDPPSAEQVKVIESWLTLSTGVLQTDVPIHPSDMATAVVLILLNESSHNVTWDLCQLFWGTLLQSNMYWTRVVAVMISLGKPPWGPALANSLGSRAGKIIVC